MEFTHEVIDDFILIHVDGDNLDAGRSYEFKEEIKQLVDEKRIFRLVIDLSSIRFIDSSGLGCLIAALRLSHAGNGEVRLCGMCKQVRSVFELVSLDKLFLTFITPEEAVQSFRVSV